MSLTDAVSTCFRKWVTFSGRAGRAEYWWFTLFTVLVYTAAFAVVVPITVSSRSAAPLYLLDVLAVVVLLPSLSVFIRRLHDTDHSGWWYFFNLIPLVGAIVLFVFTLTEGTRGENRFGNDPQIRGRSY
jgi:uncharacterized membrane protein YhaH (DUF805 family)